MPVQRGAEQGGEEAAEESVGRSSRLGRCGSRLARQSQVEVYFHFSFEFLDSNLVPLKPKLERRPLCYAAPLKQHFPFINLLTFKFIHSRGFTHSIKV